MYRSGPGLYMIWILCWWILSWMHCYHWDSIVASFLNIATSSLWSVIAFTSFVNNSDRICLSHHFTIDVAVSGLGTVQLLLSMLLLRG